MCSIKHGHLRKCTRKKKNRACRKPVVRNYITIFWDLLLPIWPWLPGWPQHPCSAWYKSYLSSSNDWSFKNCAWQSESWGCWVCFKFPNQESHFNPWKQLMTKKLSQTWVVVASINYLNGEWDFTWRRAGIKFHCSLLQLTHKSGQVPEEF